MTTYIDLVLDERKEFDIMATIGKVLSFIGFSWLSIYCLVYRRIQLGMLGILVDILFLTGMLWGLFLTVGIFFKFRQVVLNINEDGDVFSIKTFYKTIIINKKDITSVNKISDNKELLIKCYPPFFEGEAIIIKMNNGKKFYCTYGMQEWFDNYQTQINN